MKWQKAGGIVALLGLCVLGGMFLVGRMTGGHPSATFTISRSINADAFVGARSFFWEMGRAQAASRNDKSTCQSYRGGAVNHHTLATDLLARFFSELGRCRLDVTRVIVLSPDHFHVGQTFITTFTDGYRTQGDFVSVDQKAVEDLLAEVPSARVNHDLFVNEHGVASLIPFLHQALPTASVVPVTINASISQTEAETMVQWLKGELKDLHTIVIVSSDMSHYLADVQARKNDAKTREAFQTGDRAFFFPANDDFTDNGRSIWIALTAFDQVTWQEQSHAVSTDYGGLSAFTTSYINGFWY